MGIGIGVPAVLSLLTPWLGTTVTAMIVIRVLQGLFGGVTFPCIHDIWFHWAPIPERSRMTSIAYAGMFIGKIFKLYVCRFVKFPSDRNLQVYLYDVYIFKNLQNTILYEKSLIFLCIDFFIYLNRNCCNDADQCIFGHIFRMGERFLCIWLVRSIDGISMIYL